MIIVGAGIAGLSLAEGLLDRGIPVTVLERSSVVGGRILTHRSPQYEIGAGRIHASHKRVHALIRRFGLHTFPISDSVVYRPLSTCKDEPDNLRRILSLILQFLETQSKHTLQTNTIASLLSPEWRSHLQRFPYWAEVHMLRADLAMESFRNEMGSYRGYVGIQEGIDVLTTRLMEVVKQKGANIRFEHEVNDIRKVGHRYEIVGMSGENYDIPFQLFTEHVIIATCRCSLGTFSVLEKNPLLKRLQTSPLTRIYAQYPVGKQGPWWKDLKKTVTDSPLRFIIPINPKSGLIMISYTDGDDTHHWKSLKGVKLQKEIQKEVKRLYPDNDIPEPTFVQKHEWKSGCTYWVPGTYDLEKSLREAMNPRKGLWIVGESVSRHQAWIESALESVDTFLKFQH
jgi:monoamine oxidase